LITREEEGDAAVTEAAIPLPRKLRQHRKPCKEDGLDKTPFGHLQPSCVATLSLSPTGIEGFEVPWVPLVRYKKAGLDRWSIVVFKRASRSETYVCA